MLENKLEEIGIKNCSNSISNIVISINCLILENIKFLYFIFHEAIKLIEYDDENIEDDKYIKDDGSNENNDNSYK